MDIRVKSQLSFWPALIRNNNFVNFCVAKEPNISVMEVSIDVKVTRDSQYTLEFLKTYVWMGQPLPYLNGIILKGMVR